MQIQIQTINGNRIWPELAISKSLLLQNLADDNFLMEPLNCELDVEDNDWQTLEHYLFDGKRPNGTV